MFGQKVRWLLFSAVFCILAAGFVCSCSVLGPQRSPSRGEAAVGQDNNSGSSSGGGGNGTGNTTNSNSYGYALLYDLVKDEKNVSKLRFIKRERPELKSLLQEIARVNHEACSRIEAFAKTNAAVDIRNQGLPIVEVQVREAIGKFKENAILHSKDKDLEVQLLLSQNEALTYGSHLAGVIGAGETDATRKQFLQQLATTLSGLQQKVFALLLKNYS